MMRKDTMNLQSWVRIQYLKQSNESRDFGIKLKKSGIIYDISGTEQLNSASVWEQKVTHWYC